jgi:HD superfamily phosphohydrolase
MEQVLGVHHERMTMLAVTESDTTLHHTLKDFAADLPERVAAIIDGTFKPAALAQLVSSQLDVDRMDYLLRDSLMTGAKYGLYDLEWIINALQIDTSNDRVYVAARGVHAVEEYLQARYYMFRQVYFHRTLRSAEAVLRSALRRALQLVQAGVEVWCTPGTAFEKILRRQPLNIAEHLSMDDSDVIFHMKQWQRSDDSILRDLSLRFINRRLFKAIDLDMPKSDRPGFLEAARAVVARAGFSPDFYFIEDHASDVPYYGYYTGEGDEPRKRIYVEEGYAHPVIREISEVSQVVRALRQGYELHRVCFPAEVKDEIYRLYHAPGPDQHSVATS